MFILSTSRMFTFIFTFFAEKRENMLLQHKLRTNSHSVGIRQLFISAWIFFQANLGANVSNTMKQSIYASIAQTPNSKAIEVRNCKCWARPRPSTVKYICNILPKKMLSFRSVSFLFAQQTPFCTAHIMYVLCYVIYDLSVRRVSHDNLYSTRLNNKTLCYFPSALLKLFHPYSFASRTYRYYLERLPIRVLVSRLSTLAAKELAFCPNTHFLDENVRKKHGPDYILKHNPRKHFRASLESFNFARNC